MDYLHEEIELVRFCEKQDPRVVCKRRRKECPASRAKSCKEDNPSCSQMLAAMEKGEKLSDEHIRIVNFWLNELKWDDNCIPDGSDKRCPNIRRCDEMSICEGLLNKLGIFAPYNYDIYEKDIQRVVVNDLRKSLIKWHTNDELDFLAEKPRIGAGEPDILLKSTKGNTLYVVELKVVSATEDDVGQLSKYVGWYKEHPIEGYSVVKGLLLAPEFSKGAEYAIKAHDNLDKRCFDLHVEVKPDGQGDTNCD